MKELRSRVSSTNDAIDSRHYVYYARVRLRCHGSLILESPLAGGVALKLRGRRFVFGNYLVRDSKRKQKLFASRSTNFFFLDIPRFCHAENSSEPSQLPSSRSECCKLVFPLDCFTHYLASIPISAVSTSISNRYLVVTAPRKHFWEFLRHVRSRRLPDLGG